MARRRLLLALYLIAHIGGAAAQDTAALANPAIDIDGYLQVASLAAQHRETRRLTEDEFIRMSHRPGTVILDARSKQMYDFLHVRGAINLSFPDIAIASLAETIPDKSTHILIYCNNNFANLEMAFATKVARASLNLSTYVALYAYGYRNVYELGPLLDGRTTKIRFQGSLAGR